MNQSYYAYLFLQMAVKKTIVRTDSISIDRIDGKFDDDFISCPICSNVLWKPVACKTCENAFCMKCIRIWLKDNPNKCPFQCRFQERKPPPILLKILSKLQLTCRHATNGCAAVLSYEALEKHEQQECGYQLVQCPVCSKEMLQKELESHAAEECPSKEVTCFKCGSAYLQREGHREEQCLQAQIKTLEEKLRDRDEKPQKVVKNYERMIVSLDSSKRAHRSTGWRRTNSDTNHLVLRIVANFNNRFLPHSQFPNEFWDCAKWLRRFQLGERLLYEEGCNNA